MEVNAVGDLVVDEPEALRAIASAERLSLLDRLRRGEPVEAADLPHLEELERLGFVTREGDHWSVVGKGIFFEIPDEPERQAAARELTQVMLLHYEGLPRRWVEESEPSLSVDWARAAGMFNARVTLTPVELTHLQEELERLFAPYTSRSDENAPADAAPVRILAYFLPEPPGS